VSKELRQHFGRLVKSHVPAGEIAWTYAGNNFYADDLIEILETDEDPATGDAYVAQLMVAAEQLLRAVKTGNGDEGEGRLQSFLYLLMRDKLPTSDVVDCVKAVEGTDGDNVFTAEGLAAYAGELGRRLLGKS